MEFLGPGGENRLGCYVQDLYDGQRMRPEKLAAWQALNGNTAAGNGPVASGGGIISAQGEPGSLPTTLTLNNSQVDNNRAGGSGGGIANGDRQHRHPGRRHLQQRRNCDPVHDVYHRQHPG